MKIHVVIFAFDLLFLNGEVGIRSSLDVQSLIQKPLRDRRALLRENFKEVEGKIHFASFMDDNDTEKIQAFLLESVASGCEGLMIKTLEENATYEPSKRSLNWLKVGRFFGMAKIETFARIPSIVVFRFQISSKCDRIRSVSSRHHVSLRLSPKLQY